MAIRFHLDENVAGPIAHALRNRGVDVTTTAEARLISATDEEHIEFARRESRVIYTQDRDFLELATTMEHSGIIYNKVGSRTTRQVIEFLVLLTECATTDEMRNAVEFVPK